MKKTFVSITLVVILACALIFSASAASFEHLADDLNALGLFRGTDSGYDLDRAPNRIEALVMLLRLYGLEEEALTCESDHPFTDVSGWQIPYVAYAFENGYTAGMTDTTFNPGGICSAQMYVTFVLRALGYSDAEGGDFAYADALDFGAGLGIIDDFVADGDFLRDQMVAVSYLALSAAPKDGEFSTLFEKLAAAGALAEDGIAAFKAKQELFNELKATALKLISEQAIAMSIKAGVDPGGMGALLAGMGMDLNIGIDMGLCYITGDAPEAAIGLVLTRSGENQELQVYFKDGVLYENIDGEKNRVDLFTAESEDENPPNMLFTMDTSQIPSLSHLISGISKDVEGGLVVYTIKPGEAIASAVMDNVLELAVYSALGDSLPAGVDLSAMDVSLNALDIKIYTDTGGMFKKCVAYTEMSLGTDIGGLPIKLTLKISVEAELTATGDDVAIDFPDDLGEYELIDADALFEFNFNIAA